MFPETASPPAGFEDQITLPDYAGGGLVNLMSSIATGLGGSSAYPPLAMLPPALLERARHVVLLVVDGLGDTYVRAHGGTLAAHRIGPVTSVFPSTTASAIPTFLTGLAPQQHGLTGWNMYFREVGAVVAPLPFCVRTGRQELRRAGVTPGELFGLTPLFDRLPVPSHVVSPRHIVHSDFNVALSGRAQRHGYEALDELVALVAGILKSGEARSYVHAYWPQLDCLAHEYGVGSDEVADAYRALDAAFAALGEMATAHDSVILVTADHGFVDTAPDETIDLADHPQLRDTLVLPLCGEPRAAFAYVRAGREARFETYVREVLGDRVHVIRSSEAVARGWLGAGAAHPALVDRLGDYILLPTGRAILRDWLLGEAHHVHVGVHGGVSADEMTVPLVVAPPVTGILGGARGHLIGNDVY